MTDLTDMLSLQVQTARNDAFVWGVSTWTGYHYGGPADTAGAGTEWMDIMGVSREITIHRGLSKNGLDLNLEAGTLEATVLDSKVDPNTNPYIKPGTPIRLMNYWDTTTAVFTGVIENVKVTYKNRKPQVRITAVDRVKALANINRSGTIAAPYDDRVRDLLTKHGIPNSVVGATGKSLAQNAYDSSLLNHLTLATTSERGHIFVDRDNVVRAFGGSVKDVGRNKGNVLENPFLVNPTLATMPDTWNAYSAGTISGGVRNAPVTPYGEVRLWANDLTGTQRFGVRLDEYNVKASTMYAWSFNKRSTGLGRYRFYVDSVDSSGVSTNIKSQYLTATDERVSIYFTTLASTKYIKIYVWIEAPATGTATGTTFAGFSFPFLEKNQNTYGYDKWQKPNNYFVDYKIPAGSYDNLIPNPALETNTTGWASFGCTAARSNEWSNSGDWSLKVTRTTGTHTGINCGATGSEIYWAGDHVSVLTASAVVYSPVDIKAGIDIRSNVTADKIYVPQVMYDIPANTPVRVVVEGQAQVAGSTADYLKPELRLYKTDGSNLDTGMVAYVDEAFFSANLEAIGDLYFDGTTKGAEWWGTPHASGSTLVYSDWASYVDIGVGYDSASLVNDVYINNLTYGLDEAMNPVSISTKWGPYRNVTSIATFGASSGEVDTNLATELDIEDFATAILASNDSPELRVERVRLNLTNQPDMAANLEVFDTVNVEYTAEGFHIDEDFSVLSITHQIIASNTEHRWMVDVDLISNTEEI